MTKKRKFKKEYGKELLRIAEGDLESAKGLHKIKVGRTENVLFLAEQAIEKALKAVLCWREIPTPIVHDLGIILENFPEPIVVPDAENMLDLGQFATIRRYEEGVAQFTTEEIADVIALAEKTVLWASRQISK